MVFKEMEKYKNSSGIYKITHEVSGKVYVGQTKMKFKKRFWHHNWKLNNNSHDNQYLQNVWNKHNKTGFSFEILEILDRDEDMNPYEIGYINELNSYGEGGFNLTVGGEGKKGCPMPEESRKIVGEKNRIHNLGKKHSELTKMRMRLSSPRRKMTPENRELLNKSRIGIKHTEESKKQMSESHTGKGSVLNNTKAELIKIKLINGETRGDIAEFMDVSYAVVKSVDEEVAWSHVSVAGWKDYLKEQKKNKKPRKNKLTDDKVHEIRNLLANGMTQADISRKFDIGNCVISNIKNGKTYIDVK